MGTRPHILVIDPAPSRAGLAGRLEALGASCTVARGLHDAMVQCILRNPAVIVADLTLPGSAGPEARRRLGRIPHFQGAPFLTLGDGGDLPAGADDEAVTGRVRGLLPVVAPVAGTAPEPVPEPPEPDAPAPDSPPESPPGPPGEPSDLGATLARLGREGVDATLAVRGADGRVGEVMVRDGVPIHAVTVDGLVGPEALEAMERWPEPAVEAGGAPRPETPVTLPPAPGATAGAPADETAQDAVNAHERVRDLLEALEAVGVIRRAEP